VSIAIIQRAAAHIQYRCIEPVQTAVRKPSRLRSFGIGALAALPQAAIDLRASEPGCGRDCAVLIEAHRRYLSKYLFCAEDGAFPAAGWRGVPLLIDLADYPDFTAYAERLKRQSKGALLRQIDRARRRGFWCEPFDRKDFGDDRYRIDRSKLFRSGGPVLQAALPFRPRHRPPTAAYVCPLHWYADWGVFRRADDGGGAQLVGYTFLKRVGAVVRVTQFMGHGAYLSDGVMKLLFFDALRWLFERDDPRLAGIRYVHYGAIEHGGAGLALWKRRFQFQPFVFAWAPAVDGARSFPREAKMAGAGQIV
jgi:hypothetical protein